MGSEVGLRTLYEITIIAQETIDPSPSNPVSSTLVPRHNRRVII